MGRLRTTFKLEIELERKRNKGIYLNIFFYSIKLMDKRKRMIDNRTFHQSVLDRLGWIYKIQPISLASFVSRILAPDEIRRIVETDMGIRVYANPLKKPMGREITLSRMYEPDTFETLKEEIEPGDTVIDIGPMRAYLQPYRENYAGKTDW